MSACGRRFPAWLALAFLAASQAPRAHAAQVPLPPRPAQYATDRAQVFPPARLAALNARLADFERVTSNQVLVYVDRSLPPGTSLEEMGATAIRQWGVGQKGKSNGVIIFVFTDDRALRLEVGYGLEGVLPDARARQITSDVIKPFLKRGDTAGGIEAGVEAVFAAVRGEGFQGTGRTAAEGLRGRASGGYSFALVVFLVAGVFIILVVALIIWAVKQASGEGRTSSPSDPSSASSSSSDSSSSSSSASSSSSDSSDSSDSSSSSSSDFSGGGGDGGGGGSSDSW
ncbi:MAG TPA: TPM domain-containing protein [Vicinamibacteria bacterium]|nr:TPM domain-containing protein [Vicinamibacteria bacterium]